MATKKTYYEKLKDPRWQKKRLEIMERDGFQCQSCLNPRDTLNVHHLLYENEKDPWEVDSRWLVTVCEPCHKQITENLERINFLCRIMSRDVHVSGVLRDVVERISDLT